MVNGHHSRRARRLTPFEFNHTRPSISSNSAVILPCALYATQKAANRLKSTVRVRVEHVFGAQAQMGGHLVRNVGLARVQFKIGMMNLVYNMKRLGQLLKRDAQRLLCPGPRSDPPMAA